LYLSFLKASNFRLFNNLELELDKKYNLIYGENGSGKTSVLEAISYLGRGRSFRTNNVADIIRWGAEDLLVYGRTISPVSESSLGIINGKSGLESSINGDHTMGIAGLARALPFQVIDPNTHNLIGGPPEARRNYIDWILFHVEPGYNDIWRKYKKTLKQRNALLKSYKSKPEIQNWDQGLAQLGEKISIMRDEIYILLEPVLAEFTRELLDTDIRLVLNRGWSRDASLIGSLSNHINQDIQYKSTQLGPHRADIRVSLETGAAKKHISRGQQKLLACAFINASIELVQSHTDKPILLLLDDPKAELDNNSTKKLIKQVRALKSQVVATSIEADESLFGSRTKLFHVEQINKKTN
jgi:DNA replication and repair protein RecF